MPDLLIIDATTDTDATIDSITARIIAQHAPVVVHEFTSSTENNRVLGFCSCFGWSCESDGATTQSKQWVESLHAAHVRRETA